MASDPFERKIVKQALLEWLLHKKAFDRVLGDVLKEHRVGSAQRATITAWAYAFVRNLGLFLPRPVKPESPPWQRDFDALLERAGDGPEAIEKWHARAKPSFEADALRHFTDIHAVPAFLAREFMAVPGAWHDYLHASLREAPLFVRLNPLKMSSKDFEKRFADRGLETRWLPHSYRFATRWAITQDEAFLDGAFEIQDEHSQIVGWVAAPKPGERVLDLCAGAGGKTLHLASLMGGEGEIVSYDVDKRKLAELAARAKRGGFRNVKVSENLPRSAELFDVVVVDAPCSGLGTLRRNPERLYSVKEEELQGLSRLQVDIGDRAVNYLKPGGRLVYATCTPRPQENELVVKRIVDKTKLRLVSVPRALVASIGTNSGLANFLAEAKAGAAGRIGAAFAFDSSSEDCLRLGPSQASGAISGDGFFVALLH